MMHVSPNDFSEPARVACLLRLVADLVEAGHLRPTPLELARWAAAQPNGLTADVLSAVSEAMLRSKWR
jgi:hypothetical protein